MMTLTQGEKRDMVRALSEAIDSVNALVGAHSHRVERDGKWMYEVIPEFAWRVRWWRYQIKRWRVLRERFEK